MPKCLDRIPPKIINVHVNSSGEPHLPATLQDKCYALVAELGLGRVEDICSVEPLTGGVASDIARIDIAGRSYCMKFALPKLKVAVDWHAPVHRNAAEYAWLKVAAEVLPDSAVRLFGRSEVQHGFAMDYLVGQDVYLWKKALLEGAPDRKEAEGVGDLVGRIHAVSAQVGFERTPFRNRDDFHALRIEPYLIYTALAYPAVASKLNDLADMLYQSNDVLVHGDVSPKNILLRGGGPVILDAECATMGDASFDPSFCLNHLVLKAFHLPSSRKSLFKQVTAFWRAYAQHVHWEDPSELEKRICRLLPALMLGRVDGKSPVEYLGEGERNTVRNLAIDLIEEPSETLADFVGHLGNSLKGQTQ